MANLCVPLRSKKIPKGNIKKKTPDEVYGFITHRGGKDDTYGFVTYNPKSAKHRHLRLQLTPGTSNNNKLKQKDTQSNSKASNDEHLKAFDAYKEIKAIKITTDNVNGDIKTVEDDTETLERSKESKHCPIYDNIGKDNDINEVVPVGSKAEQTSTQDLKDKALPEETVKATPQDRKHPGYRAHPPFVEVHPPGLFKATMIHIHDMTDSSDTASSRLQYLTTSSEDSSDDESAPWPGRGPPGVIKVSDRSIRDTEREHIQSSACNEHLNTSELQRFNYNGVMDIIKEYENDPKERYAKTRKLPMEKTHKLSMEKTHKLSDDTSDYDTPPPLPPKIIYVQATDVTSSSEIKHNEACHDKSKSETIPNQVGQKLHNIKQSGNTKKHEIETATDTNDSGNDSPQDRSNNSENVSVNSSIDAELDRWLAEQKEQKLPLPPRINNSSIKDNTQSRQTPIAQEMCINGLESSMPCANVSTTVIEEIIDTPDSPGNYETIDSWLNQQKSPSSDTTKKQKESTDKPNMKSDSVKHFNSCCDANLEKWLDEQKSKKPKENSKQSKVNIKLRKNISQKDPSGHETKLSRNSTWSLGATSSTPVPSPIIVSPRAYVKDTTLMTLGDIIECLQNANSLKPVYIKMHVRAEYTPDDDWTAKDEIKVESDTIVNALYKQGEWAFVRTEDERGGFVPYKNLEPVNYKPIKVTDFCQQFPDGLESVIETTEDDSAFLPYGKHQNDNIPAVQGTQITQTINHQNTPAEFEEDIYVEMNSPITTSHARSKSLPETMSSPTLSPRTKPLSSMKPCGCTNHHNCKASNIRTQHDPNGVSETVLKRIDKKGEINKILRVRSRSRNSSKRPSCDRKLYTESIKSTQPLENHSATGKSSSNKNNPQEMRPALHQRRCSEDSLLSPIAAAQIYLHDSDDSEVFNTTNAKINSDQIKEDINTMKHTKQESSANLERLRNLKSQLAGMNASDIADDLVQESIDMLENHLQNQLYKKTVVDPRSKPVEVDQGSTDSKEFTGELLVGGDCTFIEHSIQSENAALGPTRNLLSPELFSEDMEISQQASSGHGTLSSNIDEGVAQGMEPQSSRSRMKSQDSLERCKSWLDELYSKTHDHTQRRTSAPSIHLKTSKRTMKPKTKDPFGLVDDLSPIVARSETRTFETRTIDKRPSDRGTLYQNAKYKDILFNDEEEPIYEEYSLKTSKENPPQKTMSDAIRGYESSTNTMETVIYNKSKGTKISKHPHSELKRSRSKSELKMADIMDRDNNDDQYIQLNNTMKVSTEQKTHPSEHINTINQLMVLFDFDAKQEDDLTVKKKEVVKLLENDDPHWVLVENINGQQGYIPESYTTNLVKLHLDPKAKTTYF